MLVVSVFSVYIYGSLFSPDIFEILLLTMVALEARPQIAGGCHDEGATLLFSLPISWADSVISSIYNVCFYFHKTKVFCWLERERQYSLKWQWDWSSLALSTSEHPFLYCALCLQVFGRFFCHLSTYRLIWSLAAVTLCRAQGKDTQFPCLQSGKHDFWSEDVWPLLFVLSWFICMHELFKRIIHLEEWKWFFLLPTVLFSK